MNLLKYKILDLRDKDHDYILQGSIKFKNLAVITYDNKRFIVYEVIDPKTGEPQRYIEQLIAKQYSDKLFGSDELKYVEDDILWKKLLTIAQKEGIL